jgi:adenosylcobinamide-phosphate synthase
MVLNVLLAFFLDLLIGDPVFGGHPVRLIGYMLTLFERIFYPFRWKLFAGFLLVFCSLFVVFTLTLVLNWLKRFLVLPFSLNVLTIFLLYFLFCNRDMVREAKSVYRALEECDLTLARGRVARIVGRDTARLDVRGVIRATVESVAENLVDGFTAPLFYFLIGGIPFAYIYKTVNTIDSRFGYRNSRYERFGKIGARLDDVLNFIPARLNGFFLYCASGFKAAVLETMVRDGRKNPSPNSGIAEAGFSALLGLRLGGPSVYGTVLKDKPWIGEDRLQDGELENPHLILRAVAFYWRVVLVTLFVSLACLSLLELPLVFS